MLTRSFICSLAVLIALTATVRVAAAPADRSEKFKAEVKKLSPLTLVNVKTVKGEKIRGYITQVLDDSFDITEEGTRQITTIPYDEVESIKKPGWSKGAKIALGVGIGAAVVVGVIVTARGRRLSGFCPLGCNTILRP